MSIATLKKFKWFWHDQDVQQEEWLRAMALQGWHLKKLNLLQQWTFVKGEPADMVYRVDFKNKAISPAYRRLLEDAGWEHAVQFAGWQYWRTKAVNGRAPELFTDAASRAAKFKHLLTIIFVCSFPTILFVSFPQKFHVLEQLSAPFLILVGAAMLVNVVALVRLTARLVRMRREEA